MANKQGGPKNGGMTKPSTVQTGRDKLLMNKSTYGNRIRSLRLARGMNQPQLAAALGITKNAITNWEAGASRPDLDTVAKLCEVLDMSADTFFNLPNRADAMSGDEWELIRTLRQLSKHERRTVAQLVDAMLENNAQAFREACAENFERLELSLLPASAGTGEPLYDSYERKYVYLRVNRDVCRADEVIAVHGDSMAPTFCDGDELLVEHTKALEPGEIGVFVVAAEGYVKEYRPDGLHSHNPKYKTICPTEDDDVRCVGRVLCAVSETWRATPGEQVVLDEIYTAKRRK
jgi:repressor LexA